MRSRLQFWLDRWPWWTANITHAITWTACKLTGHVPMQNWNWRAGTYWHCAWCLQDVPTPSSSADGTTTSNEEQA